jgi:hypothetical protein
MASHFKTLAQAKTEYKNRTGADCKNSHEALSPVKIFNRNKGRKKRKLKPLAKPYFIGTELEWLNL